MAIEHWLEHEWFLPQLYSKWLWYLEIFLWNCFKCFGLYYDNRVLLIYQFMIIVTNKLRFQKLYKWIQKLIYLRKILFVVILLVATIYCWRFICNCKTKSTKRMLGSFILREIYWPEAILVALIINYWLLNGILKSYFKNKLRPTNPIMWGLPNEWICSLCPISCCGLDYTGYICVYQQKLST